jgi:hypothetical protein
MKMDCKNPLVLFDKENPFERTINNAFEECKENKDQLIHLF